MITGGFVTVEKSTNVRFINSLAAGAALIGALVLTAGCASSTALSTPLEVEPYLSVRTETPAAATSPVPYEQALPQSR